MEIRFLTPPFDNEGTFQSIGEKLIELLTCRAPMFDRVWIVSVFANQKAIIRLSPHVAASRQAGADIRFVIGIDHHSTTVEALREILAFGVDARIINHPRPGQGTPSILNSTCSRRADKEPSCFWDQAT
jgi:hypothetical protein